MIYSFLFFLFAQLRKDSKEKSFRKVRANIQHLESCHVASRSSSFQVSSFIEYYRHSVNGAAVKQKKKTEK